MVHGNDIFGVELSSNGWHFVFPDISFARYAFVQLEYLGEFWMPLDFAIFYFSV